MTTTMILLIVSFVLIPGVAVLLLVSNIRYHGEAERLRERCADLENEIVEYELAACHRAHVSYHEDPVPRYAVWRKGVTMRIDVRVFPIDTDDPADRDYKRICAEELAEALNAKP